MEGAPSSEARDSAEPGTSANGKSLGKQEEREGLIETFALCLAKKNIILSSTQILEVCLSLCPCAIVILTTPKNSCQSHLKRRL